ncbi:MAG: histidine-type phosphatase [Clostridia bacterium]|nr:histidine-type phosphatase [Clostridia bacterium]
MLHQGGFNRQFKDNGLRRSRRIGKRIAALFLAWVLVLAAGCANVDAKGTAATEEGPYTLEKVVVLSRHNIRSPMSGSGSLLSDITPHTWVSWSSDPSELSVRGGVLETIMGEYFRLRMEDEGLFPKNYRPESGEVRFYSNAKQRTIATSTCFAAGLLPVWETPIETHAEYDTMDPTFTPKLNFVTPAYEADVQKQIAGMSGKAGLKGIHKDLRDAISLLMDVADIRKSESYRKGTYGNLLKDLTEIQLVEGKEPSMTGPIKTATSVADALTLQYYEDSDAKRAAFNHNLTEKDWRKLHSIVDTYTEMLFTAPLVSVNVAHPLLEELRSELTAEERKFTFLCGHDSNIASVLAALGAEEYDLPNTVEPKTPIGAKLVFSRYRSPEGKAYYTVSLIYQSTEQLRNISLLTLENPPMEQYLRFAGAKANADHMIAEEDLLALFDDAIRAYDLLEEEYLGEALDQAA